MNPLQKLESASAFEPKKVDDIQLAGRTHIKIAGPRTQKAPSEGCCTSSGKLRTDDVEETWICTCARLAIEPGRVAVERKFVIADDPLTGVAAGLIATAEVLTEPVDCTGVLMPSPFRKIVTIEPDAAGFAQLFWVPSALRAKGSNPDTL